MKNVFPSKHVLLLLALLTLALPSLAEELSIVSAQIVKTNSSLGPAARTKIANLSLEGLPAEVSKQLLRESKVNGFLLEEYANAVKDDDQKKLETIRAAGPHDEIPRVGRETSRLRFALSDGTKVELSDLDHWHLKGYLPEEFFALFWENASISELPGTQTDVPFPAP